MAWSVARACLQAVTIDEADTYVALVAPGNLWAASANNHVLNTLLMRVSTAIFGASAFTLRLPALFGAALYLAAVYCLVRLISPRRVLQGALFVCLTCNPLVMDYLVAARGYSMAMAFLLWMVVLAARYREAKLVRTCVLISLSAGLCVSANFSFAIADALTAFALYIWIVRQHRGEYLKILGALVFPGLALGLAITGPVLPHWSRSQLTWGADSLSQMVTGLIRSSVNSPLGTALYLTLSVLAVWRMTMLLLEMPVENQLQPLANPLAVICGTVWLAAVVCHEVLLLAYGIPLPLDRTALWLVLLFFVMAGAMAAPRLPSPAGRFSGHALAAILVLTAGYNLTCLRLTYFHEWKYDADIRNVYQVLAAYNHRDGLVSISANWRYVAALNCYRLLSGRESFEQIPGPPAALGDYPTGYRAYVLYYPVDHDFIGRQGLRVVYHGEFTGAAVAVRPDPR
jgi:hypothetical protein